MDKPISSFLRITFLVHFIFGGILGISLFSVPGRTLTWLGYIPESVQVPGTQLIVPGTNFVEPILIRLLGAGVLALAFSSFLGWRASTWGQIALIVQVEIVYCLLGSLAIILSIVLQGIAKPIIVYILLIILLGFAMAWSWVYRHGSRK